MHVFITLFKRIFVFKYNYAHKDFTLRLIRMTISPDVFRQAGLCNELSNTIFTKGL
jgi:hypothetical protein